VQSVSSETENSQTFINYYRTRYRGSPLNSAHCLFKNWSRFCLNAIKCNQINNFCIVHYKNAEKQTQSTCSMKATWCTKHSNKDIRGQLEVRSRMLTTGAWQQQQHKSSTESLSSCFQSYQHQIHHCTQQYTHEWITHAVTLKVHGHGQTHSGNLCGFKLDM